VHEASGRRSLLTFAYDGPVTLGAPIGGGKYHDTLAAPGAGDVVIKGTRGNDVTFAAKHGKPLRLHRPLRQARGPRQDRHHARVVATPARADAGGRTGRAVDPTQAGAPPRWTTARRVEVTSAPVTPNHGWCRGGTDLGV